MVAGAAARDPVQCHAAPQRSRAVVVAGWERAGAADRLGWWVRVHVAPLGVGGAQHQNRRPQPSCWCCDCWVPRSCLDETVRTRSVDPAACLRSTMLAVCVLNQGESSAHQHAVSILGFPGSQRLRRGCLQHTAEAARRWMDEAALSRLVLGPVEHECRSPSHFPQVTPCNPRCDSICLVQNMQALFLTSCWNRPYAITEFGAAGAWMVPQTPWKAGQLLCELA